MKYYTVAEIDITDRSWTKEYVKHVTPMVERYGGRYLARTFNHEKGEGGRPAPQLFLLIEWPSTEAAESFANSEEYRPYREARQRGAKTESLMVPGEDVNKVAKIPE